MEFVDLRSDTVTKPTPAMREAMARAEVGDDVYGEDPNINRLQEIAAYMVKKEEGLFVPSGTMGNLAAVLSHCQRGDEVMMGHLGHTFLFEAGGVSALGGVHPQTLHNQTDGTINLEEINDGIRSEDPHFPISRLVILENTHNRCGGVPLKVGYTRAVGELVHEKGLSLHLDGARIFNAAIALGESAADLAMHADSVTFCLSKGLCAPVGSVLCGSRDFIRRARRIRKQLGGGMRQAGILAAAGIIALETMVDRLVEDHERAKLLANNLAEISGIIPDTNHPPTNMVFVSLADTVSQNASQIKVKLAEHKILIGVIGERRFRMVTHYEVDDKGIDQVVNAFRMVLAEDGYA
jgi:threonine aldolase